MDTFYVNLWDDFMHGNGISYSTDGIGVSVFESLGEFITSDLNGFAICW